MKDKLYWDDAYKLEFEAEIVDRVDTDDALGLVLSGTYFYPEGGGQPADKGSLGEALLQDVQEVDGRIVHYIAASASRQDEFSAGANVSGVVDGDNRKQNMRAHTGAHLLFGAARKLFSKLEYAGFDIHAGGGSLYLETDSAITPGLMHRILEGANGAVVDELSVGTYFVKPEEVANIRGCVWNVKLPPDQVRIVEIDGWDVAVCSGTHLGKSIEVGPLGITNRETHKKGVTRLDYLVGRAAVNHFTAAERAIGEMGSILNTARDELTSAAARVVNAVQEEQKRARKLQDQLAGYRLQELLAGGETVGETTLITGIVPDVNQKALQPLVARALKEREKTIVALVGTGEKAFIVAGRSDDLGHDLREPVVAVARQHGGGGGGAAHLLSAGGITSSAEEVLADLKAAILPALV